MRYVSVLLVILSLPALASAQGFRAPGEKAGSWEFAVSANYQQSETAAGINGTEIDVDSTVGLGFNAGYYFTNRLMLGGEVTWLRPDYTARLVDDSGEEVTVRHTLDQFNMLIKGTFNLLDTPFTPYLEAGAGWTYLDSNVADGPPLVGCWWHPWYGYICEGYYQTFHETMTTWGGTAGFRFQASGGTVFKLGYSVFTLEGDSGDAEPSTEAVRFEVAWGF